MRARITFRTRPGSPPLHDSCCSKVQLVRLLPEAVGSFRLNAPSPSGGGPCAHMAQPHELQAGYGLIFRLMVLFVSFFRKIFFGLLDAKPCRTIMKLPQKVRLGSETCEIETKL